MSDCFIGEIRMFGGNFAPLDWAQCDGQTLSISQNQTLFALIGTTYGGDGTTNFKLPDLRGRIPLHRGTGSGLTTRTIGQSFGTENAEINTAQLPTHTHALYASANTGTAYNPAGNVLATSMPAGMQIYSNSTAAPINMSPSALGNAGSNMAHANVMPALCVNFIIALNGIWPSQS